LAAGLFDLGLGGRRELRGGDLERAGDFTVAENLDRLLALADQTGRGQRRGVDLRDRGIQRAELADVEDRDLGAEFVIVEAALGQLAVKGHLAAFKTGADAAAGTGRLALATATGGLAVAAAFAAADTLLAVHGTGDVLEFVKFHGCFLDWAPHPDIRGKELGFC